MGCLELTAFHSCYLVPAPSGPSVESHWSQDVATGARRKPLRREKYTGHIKGSSRELSSSPWRVIYWTAWQLVCLPLCDASPATCILQGDPEVQSGLHP